MDLNAFVKTYENFPKEGVRFRDINPLISNPKAFSHVMKRFVEKYYPMNPDKIAAIEAKGFLIGAPLALALKKPLVLLRKAGGLPGMTSREPYEKEYGKGELEMQGGSIFEGERVVVVYDILAGSGASKAAIRLLEGSGGRVVGLGFVTELSYLGGREGLEGYDVFSLVKLDE